MIWGYWDDRPAVWCGTDFTVAILSDTVDVTYVKRYSPSFRRSLSVSSFTTMFQGHNTIRQLQ